MQVSELVVRTSHNKFDVDLPQVIPMILSNQTMQPKDELFQRHATIGPCFYENEKNKENGCLRGDVNPKKDRIGQGDFMWDVPIWENDQKALALKDSK